ncbi:hypothetical protein Glove_13g228 [Diversispora epigaea]|uniref:BTB domain-containing protein n=1 Tax=Diversispora epigaea TaxID=1348612 RepID=A0A397JYK6_9GLOM|nr:hypothetical protein Glove_13g228 [Diversispora epigaea]
MESEKGVDKMRNKIRNKMGNNGTNILVDFIKLLENGDEHNVIIEVGESTIMQPFKVHSTVLCYRCPYLYDEFKKLTISNDDNIRIIQKPQISDKIFDIIIKYIYGATVNLEKLKLLFQTNNLKALQNYCNDIIAKHPNLIFESNDFNTLPEAALVSIIQRDDLQLEESKVWDYVIQWGISQNKTLPSDVDDWIDKDFQILKIHCNNFYPIFDIFKFPVKILWKNRDGFDPKVFWNLCDQKINVVVVAKVKDTDEILGGYNPIGWNSNLRNQYSKPDDSFIFSLKNGNIKNSILSRVKVPSKAIYNNSYEAACFGNDLYGSQSFFICRIEGYEKLIRKRTGLFSIDDYEVFQISERKNI